MKTPFIDLRAQYSSIKEEIKKELDDVLENTAFILGKKVENFENEFAKFCNAKFALGVGSGTAALRLALLAVGIKQNDEVITVPNTFIATAEAISQVGAKPVFVDIDPKTYNIDINQIEKNITKKTKAILPVHLYGQPADMSAIIEIAEKHNLKIIEDACQAHGAEYKGKRVPISDIACFSFYPGKNLGAYGEGGAVVTNNEEIAQKIKMLRDHGQEKKYVHKLIGDNSRLEGFQGAVLGVKLKYLDKWTEMRRKNAQTYSKLLEDTGVVTPFEIEYAKHVYHLYIIKVKNRDKLQEYLQTKEIGTGLHYPIPIHLQDAYKHLNIKAGSYPITESYVKEILSLPMYAELTKEQIEYVADSIKTFINR